MTVGDPEDAVVPGRVRKYLVEGGEFELCEEDIRRFPHSVLSRQLDSIEESEEGFFGDVIELPGRSASFFGLLVQFLKSHGSPEQQLSAARTTYRCVILSPLEGPYTEDPASDLQTKVTFVPAEGGAPAAPSYSFTKVAENLNEFIAIQAVFPHPVVCSEVNISFGIRDSSASFPPIRIEGCDASGTWQVLEQQSLTWREDAAARERSARALLRGAVPVRGFEVPEGWRDGGEREALYWRESDFYGVFDMEMSMASLILDKLLKVYLTGSSPRVFKHWPSRDRHQLWATLWLSLRFVLDRPYSAAEVDWLVARHLLEPQAALAAAVRAELLRRGFLRGPPGGGSFCISRDAIQWVLDGDKLFRARKFEAATVVGRPWWSLPLATQHILLAGGPLGGPPGPPVLERRHRAGEMAGAAEPSGSSLRCIVEDREFVFCVEDLQRFPHSALAQVLDCEQGGCPDLAGQSAEFFGLLASFLEASRTQEAPAAYVGYRCVLLEPLQGPAGERGAGAAAEFRPAGGGAPAAERCRGELQEGEHHFVVLETTFAQETICSEATVAAGAAGAGGRLPPFRLDVRGEAGEWRTALCQPLPAQDEICNQGRDVVRCFLPRAVPVQSFKVPACWLEDEQRAAAFQAGLELCQVDELEMAMGRLRLERWLEASLSGDPPLLRQWPTKDRQQSWATTWLALHFVPDRMYHESEVDWMIVTHHVGMRVPDCPMIRKELERRGLMERRPGGGGFRLVRGAARRALRAAGPAAAAA